MSKQQDDDTLSGSWITRLGENIGWQPVVLLALGLLFIPGSQGLSEYPTFSLLMKESGFALLVSVFVWLSFEFASNKKQERRIDDRIERITKNVFAGVFRRDLPEGLIDEASLIVLEAKVIRRDFQVIYTLSDDTYIKANGTAAPYVSLRAVSSFVLKNASRETHDVPIGVGLPNPIEKGLREKANVISITVSPTTPSGGPERELDLKEAKEKMRAEMTDDRSTNVYCIPEELPLKPGEEVRVKADYVMAKEVEDTEVLQSLYPSDGLHLTIVDPQHDKRIVRARSLHRVPLEGNPQDGDPSLSVYNINHHMLPHQGVLVWWKTKPQKEDVETASASC